MPYKNKDSNKEYCKKYYQEHREERLEYNRKYSQDNKEKRQKYMRKYRQENKEKIRKHTTAYFREWRLKNLEKTHKNEKKYRQSPKGKITLKRYRQSPKGKIHHRNQTHKRRAQKTVGRGITNEQWDKLLRQYNFRCAYCGIKSNMTIDHIVPLSKGGEHFIGNIVPACADCNTKKGNKLDWKPKTYKIAIGE